MAYGRADGGAEHPPCATLSGGGEGPDLWYPRSEREVPPLVGTACAGCWRRAPCLHEALMRPEEHGIWAGLPPATRRGLRQRLLLGRDPDRVIRDGLKLAEDLRNGRSRRTRVS